MTYAELKAQFTALLNRTDITNDLTELFITQALTRAQRDLRIPPQEKQLDTVVIGGFTGIDVPTDYISAIAVVTDEGDYVTYLPRGRFLELGVAPTGTPRYWTRISSEIVLNPIPVVDSTITLHYYGELTPFTTEGGETAISVAAPDLVLYGALSFASDYYLDERAVSFEQRYQSIAQALQEQAYDTDGPYIVQPSYSFPED